MPKVLVVDDDSTIRATLSRLLKSLGCAVQQADNGLAGAAALTAEPPDLVITDMQMPEGDGFVVLAAGQKAGVPVVILTAHASVELAVDAMKRGAASYLSKPFTSETVAQLLRDSLGATPTVAPRKDKPATLGPLGQDEVFRHVLQRAERAAATSATVLITGESGTGKEEVARAIHNAGRRRDAPFVPVNCAAIPEGLFESEMFGHVRGAFTNATHARKGRLQIADGGTMFLDEIGDMPVSFQVKLLRVAQGMTFETVGDATPIKVDVRLIVATHRNLEDLIAEGRFREDLYYRLNVVPIHLPPLRERIGDIPLLVHHFMAEAGRRYERRIDGIDADAMAALVAYRWPGNVRELANVIEQMVVMSPGLAPHARSSKEPPVGASASATLTIEDVPARVREPRASFAAVPAIRLPDGGVDLNELLQKIEYSLIDQALVRTQGNRSQAADLLKINRTTLVEKLKRRGESPEV